MRHDVERSDPKGSTRMQWAVTILVNVTVLTYGMQLGWVSPMIKILQSAESPVGKRLSDTEISLVAGIPSFAAIFCIPILPYIADNYGRKLSIILMAVLQTMCWIIKLCPANLYSLLGARLLCGIGAAGCFHVVPMYVKEISQDNIRGALGSLLTVFQNLGVLIMYTMGGYLEYYTVLYIVTGISVLTIVLLFRVPDSPSFLVNHGRLEEATAAIALLRSLGVNDKNVQNEIDLIKKEDDYYKSIPNISFLSIFKNKAWRRGVIVMFLIASLRGLSGAFSMINCASTLLENSATWISPELQSLAIPVFLTVGSAITMTSVDRLGRKVNSWKSKKKLLGITHFISMIAFAILATNVLLRGYGWTTPDWLTIVDIVVIMCTYGAGIAPLLFIIMSEMFNYQIRAKLTAFLCIIAWLTSFVQVLSFTAIANAFGLATSFYTFSSVNLIGVLIVIFLLPETSGKSVEQIEEKLGK